MEHDRDKLSLAVPVDHTKLSEDLANIRELLQTFGDVLEGNIIADRSSYILESGQVLMDMHTPDICASESGCAIHHASDHPLRTAPRHWHNGMILRACEHALLHPDYDSIVYLLNRDGAVDVTHECCAGKCCGIPERVIIEEVDDDDEEYDEEEWKEL